LKHEFIADIPAIKALIEKGAQPSERVAKLLFATTKDEFYKAYYKEITRKGITKKEKKNER
jgi:ribosomal protein S16